MKTQIFLSGFIFLFIVSCLNAQDISSTSRKAARGFMSYNNYRQALDEYLKLREKDSTNIEYNYSIGLCYIETNIDKSKAIQYLEWVTEQPRANSIAWYDLGRAYALNYRFDDAISAFSRYQQLVNRDDNYITAERWIEMCRNAIAFVGKPINVTFANTGSDMNSAAPDFNPFITSDETFLVFTTKRTGNVGGWTDYDGFFTSDIMFSTSKNGKWQKPKRMPNSINSPIVEESVGMSPDGSHLFVYLDNFIASGDVYLAEKTGRSFTKLTPLGKNINTKFLESSACITPNKKIIFFAAAYTDSYGGTDIYYSKKLPNGEWGVPVNAGSTINTPYDEDFPYLAPDGRSFNFSSSGHNSMGGFDIFRSEWNKDDMSFSQPENIGYPVNTPDNNFTISFTRSGRFAYIAAFRPEGFGDLDIYRLTFHDVPPPLHHITGRILNPDSSNIFKDYLSVAGKIPGEPENLNALQKADLNQPDIIITATNTITGKVEGIFRPNPRTGKYVMILPPGTYSLLVESAGYLKRTVDLQLQDYETVRDEMTLDIILNKE